MFKNFLQNKKRFALSLWAIIVVAAGYSFVSFCLYKAGAHPQQANFLRMSGKEFFYWGIFFYAPVILVGWILTSLGMHFMATRLGGNGKLKDMIAACGIATATATLGALIPDLIITPLQAFGILDYKNWDYSINHFGIWFYITWAYLLVYTILFLLLYPKTVLMVHSVRKWHAVVVGIFGFIMYQAFLLIFIR